MISYSEIEKGVRITIDNQPYEIIETQRSFKGRGHSVLQTKLKNLKTGNVVPRSFHPSENLEEADVEEKEVKFLYNHRNEYIFCYPDNPSNRFELTEDILGKKKGFFKANENIKALVFQGKIINISLPIKVQLKVTQAPPGVQGNRSEAGTKSVTLETGAIINAPLFIETGDVIEINTESGEYIKRI
ncbi:MAG: elongation factor P [Patescibacteria group bacterium]